MKRSDPDKFSDFLDTLDKLENNDRNEISEIIFLTYRMRYYASVNKNLMIPFLFLKVQNKVAKVDASILMNSGRDGYELFVLYKSFLTLIQNSLFTDKFQSGLNKNSALINEIEGIVKSGSSSNRTLGSYFLMKYYLDVEKDKPRAFGYLTDLHRQYPNNLIFTQLLTN